MSSTNLSSPNLNGAEQMKTSNSAKKMKEFLAKTGMSQSKLASMIGVPRSVITNWLKGVRNPSLSSLEKISSATNLPINFFTDKSNSINISDIKGKPIVNVNQKDYEQMQKEIELLRRELEIERKEKELLKRDK